MYVHPRDEQPCGALYLASGNRIVAIDEPPSDDFQGLFTVEPVSE